jgi:hypothetical protein
MTSEEGGNLTDVFTIGDNPKSDIVGTNNFKVCEQCELDFYPGGDWSLETRAA